MEQINLQKIALVETFVNFYLSKSKVLDERLKSDIVWFATGFKMSEFEACKEVAQGLYIKEVTDNEN